MCTLNFLLVLDIIDLIHLIACKNVNSLNPVFLAFPFPFSLSSLPSQMNITTIQEVKAAIWLSIESLLRENYYDWAFSSLFFSLCVCH